MLYVDLKVDGEVVREWFEYRNRGYGSYDTVAWMAKRRHKNKNVEVISIGDRYQGQSSGWEYTPPEGYVPDNMKHTKFAFGRKFKQVKVQAPKVDDFDET